MITHNELGDYFNFWAIKIRISKQTFCQKGENIHFES